MKTRILIKTILLLLALSLGEAVSAKALKIKAEGENQLQVLSSNQDSLVLRINVAKIDQIDKKDIDGKSFLSLKLKNYTHSNQISFPALPIKTELIEIPEKAKTEILISEAEFIELNLNELAYPYPLEPVQGPRRKTPEQKDFQWNKRLYRKNNFYKLPLAQIEEIGKLRDQRLGKLSISPFSYNPKTNILRIYTSAKFTIRFVYEDKMPSMEKNQRYFSSAFSSVRSQVLNSSAFHKSGTKAINHSDADVYLIVTDSIFHNSLQPFIEWKRKNGFEVNVLYTSSIGYSSDQIRNTLKSLYEDASSKKAFSYLLIVGSTHFIPSCKSKLANSDSFETNHMTDLHYAEYTGDFLPEVYYGRFSVNNEEELSSIIKKTMAAEDLTYERLSFMDSAVLIAGNDKNFGSTHLNPQIKYIKNTYYNEKNNINATVFLYPDSYGQAAEVASAIAKGVNLICYTGHGSIGSWDGPVFNKESIKKMDSNYIYPFIISNCCFTGSLDKNCLGEAFTTAKNRGASLFIGASNYSYFDEDFFWSVGNIQSFTSDEYSYEDTQTAAFDAWWHQNGENPSTWALSGAEILTQGNLSVLKSNSILKDYYWEIYHIFGDPSLRPYHNKPDSIKNLEYTDILYTSVNSFHAQTEPFARISLSYKGKIIASGNADAQGAFQILTSAIPDAEEMAVLQIKAQNKLPYQAFIPIREAEGARLFISQISLRDVQTKQVSEHLQAGKLYSLNLRIKNAGSETSSFVSIEGQEAEHIEFLTKNLELNLKLAPQKDTLLENVLLCKVSSHAKDKKSILIRLLSETDRKYPLNQEQRFQNFAPQWSFSFFGLNDWGERKENRQLDPGEKVSLRYQLRNTGSVPFDSLHLRFLSGHSMIQSHTKDTLIKSLAPDSVFSGIFWVEAESSCIPFEAYSLDIKGQWKEKEENFTYNNIFSAIVEDFENADFKQFDWIMDPFKPWFVSRANAYENKYSARSAILKSNDQSSLSIELETSEEDSISFFMRTSSEYSGEMYGDFIFFYINREETLKVSGDNDWKRYSFKVPKGKQKYEWIYVKDLDASYGEDAIFLDYIQFPKSMIRLGIEPDNKEDNAFNFYASTSSGKIYLHCLNAFEGRAHLSIYDLMGRLLYKETDFYIKGGNSQSELKYTTKSGQVLLIKIDYFNGKNFITQFIKCIQA